MTALLIIGILMALAGIGGLGWCVVRARALQRSDLSPEEAKVEMRRLVAVNLGSISTGFLGAALVLAALILGV
ncbi:hypothetical protein [Oceanicella sp. SM1341]|uniref:hypothetical protein n=1 Tax=Oceanicella sp. SM1341 TaxID=1548889 RepID=UPI000E4F47DB|nr:hypothetical protein [Oceanicella sp. SM1341]